MTKNGKKRKEKKVLNSKILVKFFNHPKRNADHSVWQISFCETVCGGNRKGCLVN